MKWPWSSYLNTANQSSAIASIYEERLRSTVDDDYDPEDYETEGVCKYCGVRYDPKARFCSRCGAPYPGGELDYWRTEKVRVEERRDTVRMLMTTNVYCMDTGGGEWELGDTDYYRMGDLRFASTSSD